jgi:tripartite-type tricarboxylate transporter receptor subunit TctC
MHIVKTLAAAVVGLASGSGQILAQEDYPNRPITIVVPFAAGGASDVLTRIVAENLSQQLGQRVIVQNVGGAGGTVGSQRVVTAAPDGYTLLSHHIGLATAPALYKSLPFDPQKDFEYVGLVADAPMTIIARKDFPPNNLSELIAHLKQKQDQVTYASAGIGGASFLCGLLLGERIGVKFTHVPYTGTGPALAGMLAGQTDLICDLTTGTTGHIVSGDLKPYALTAEKRLPTLPQLPTTEEAGLPGFVVSVWYGLYAPPKTPEAIVQRLSKALQVAVKDQQVAQRLDAIGTTLVAPERATPEALRAHLKAQVELWQPIIAKSGVGAAAN